MDLKREVTLLVALAKVDIGLHDHDAELSKLPAEAARVKKRINALEENKERAMARLESLKKERRTLDQSLEDHGAQIAKYKNQLMEVKTNKEYTAMLKEIETLKGQIDAKEERVLELMDEVEAAEAESKAALDAIANDRSKLDAERTELENRARTLNEEADKLQAEKPKLLAELDPTVRKRYERIQAKYGDSGVARCKDEHCGGCGTQVPPQLAVEVRKNDQLITCPLCGRILIHYDD